MVNTMLCEFYRKTQQQQQKLLTTQAFSESLNCGVLVLLNLDYSRFALGFQSALIVVLGL